MYNPQLAPSFDSVLKALNQNQIPVRYSHRGTSPGIVTIITDVHDVDSIQVGIADYVRSIHRIVPVTTVLLESYPCPTIKAAAQSVLHRIDGILAKQAVSNEFSLESMLSTFRFDGYESDVEAFKLNLVFHPILESCWNLLEFLQNGNSHRIDEQSPFHVIQKLISIAAETQPMERSLSLESIVRTAPDGLKEIPSRAAKALETLISEVRHACLIKLGSNRNTSIATGIQEHICERPCNIIAITGVAHTSNVLEESKDHPREIQLLLAERGCSVLVIDPPGIPEKFLGLAQQSTSQFPLIEQSFPKANFGSLFGNNIITEF